LIECFFIKGLSFTTREKLSFTLISLVDSTQLLILSISLASSLISCRRSLAFFNVLPTFAALPGGVAPAI
tara:strand:+ start:2534 stop:2743 length:210 start_codon:yes stop_codon:yes gene_type:complete